MPSRQIPGLDQITRYATREIPKAWHRMGGAYINKATKQEIVRVNILAVCVGLATGFGAIGFRKLLGFFQNILFLGQVDHHLINPELHTAGYWILLILPIGLVISTLLTRYLAPEATGHGVPEVIEAIQIRGGRIKKRVVAVKALASSITIASGGSVGREGPVVQIGSAIGSFFGQFFHFRPQLIKTLVGCGAAGAIAATFNTPIAGVIFAIEIIVLELKTKSFVPLVISSVFATVVSNYYLGNEPAFFVPKYTLISLTEIIFYLGLGALAGLMGVWIIRSLYAIEDAVNRIKCHFLLKPLLGGVIIAAVGLCYPQIFGVGYDAMTQVLHQEMALSLILILLLIKPLMMSLTLSVGGSGGVFAPSLFIGVMLGGGYGVIVHHYFPDLTASHGAYALVGMAAVFSATSRATFTAIVILFEMTMNYSIILPLMLVCVIADQVSWAIQKDSIYSLKLRRKGMRFINDIGVNLMGVTLVRDIMTTNIQMATTDMTIEQCAKLLLGSAHSMYPVVDKDQKLVGAVEHTVLLQQSQTTNKGEKISTLCTQSPVTVYSDESVLETVKKIKSTRDPRILVIDRSTLALQGIISPIDFVRLSSKEE